MKLESSVLSVVNEIVHDASCVCYDCGTLRVRCSQKQAEIIHYRLTENLNIAPIKVDKIDNQYIFDFQ